MCAVYIYIERERVDIPTTVFNLCLQGGILWLESISCRSRQGFKKFTNAAAQQPGSLLYRIYQSMPKPEDKL